MKQSCKMVRPSTPPKPIFLYLIRCECHVVLAGTFACVAVSGGEVCLFCVTERGKKKQPPPSPCCLLCNLVISTYCHKHTSLLWAGYVLSDGAACSLCQVIHGHGNMSGIQPRVSPRFAPLLHHHNHLKKKNAIKKKKKKNSNFKTIFSFNPGMQGGMGKW